jgi:hypothetical protein
MCKQRRPGELNRRVEQAEVDRIVERLRPDPGWSIRRQEQHVFQGLAGVNEAVVSTLPDESPWRAYALDAIGYWRQWFDNHRPDDEPLPPRFSRRRSPPDR